MPFYPDVTQGDKFTPSASLDNNVRRMVNALNGFQSGAIVGQASRTITIPVYNNTASTIIAGTAVCFTADGDICENIIPAEPIADVTKPWGVLISTLTPQAIGDCVISGPVTVTVTGIGDHAQPNPINPAVFDLSSDGAPVLFQHSDQSMINLGASTGGAEYNGYFKVVNVSDETAQKIKIVDGFSSDISTELSAGDCLINDIQFEDVEAVELTVTATSYIYLEADYNTGDKTIDFPTVTISTTKKEPAKNKAYFLLYRVLFSDSKITGISREFHGMPQLFMWGSCGE